MTVVTADAQRVTTTPNATMTTLASPTLGGATGSLWRVAMPGGVVGPWHAFPGEVLWSMVDGDAVLEVEGEPGRPLEAGDTAVLPGGVRRRLTAGLAGFTAVVTTATPGEVLREDGSSAGVPPWVA